MSNKQAAVLSGKNFEHYFTDMPKENSMATSVDFAAVKTPKTHAKVAIVVSVLAAALVVCAIAVPTAILISNPSSSTVSPNITTTTSAANPGTSSSPGSSSSPGCSQFTCADGSCISQAFVCDAYPDCADWSDENTCNCSSVGRFKCDNNLCVEMAWLCDGQNDCGDYSDERNCPCTSGFECLESKVCISSSLRCNHVGDCSDNSDEINCTCSARESACSSGKCILREWFCDGSVDCEHGDDETANCSTCSSNEFNCADHTKCIPKSDRCNLVSDCDDGSDERNCVNIATEGDAVVVLLEGGTRVPICSHGWNTNYSESICSDTGSGSLVNSSTVSSSVVSYSSHGYATVQSGATGTHVLQILSSTVSSFCSTGEVVSITCTYDVCGRRARQFEPALSQAKILQGYTAQPGSWPWQAAMYYRNRPSCGGTLIAPNWVLTAAHCVELAPTEPSKFYFKVGSVVNNQATDQQETALTEEITMHPSYDTNSLENDIALVRLKTNVTYNDYVRPACLPKSATENFNESLECYVTGWGGLDSKATLFPNFLQEAKMSLINDTVCANDPDIKRYTLYEDIMLCAGYLDGYITICNGDSGGPLVCRGRDNLWTLAGVVSWGPVSISISCKGISVFTEVAAYLNWIKQISAVS